VNEYRSPYENDGFILHGGAFLKSLTITYRNETSLVGNRKVQITTDNGDSLSMPVPMATTLVIDLVTALYDNGTLSMEAAERLSFLCQSVLADRQDRCDYCGGSGQVGAPYDPQSCNACRGTGRSEVPQMTKDEYDALVADTMTEEN
jgi:hypothetical protein